MRYLIDGCYGDANVGDECLLQAIVRMVRAAEPDAQIAAFSSDAKWTAEETGLETVEQCNPFGRNIYGSLVKGLFWRTIEAIRECDVFILGGGELFRDSTGLTATLGMFYRLLLAKWYGKRVLALGVGCQPATTAWGGFVLRRALRACDAIIFRDADSRTVAERIAPQLADGQCRPDLVFSLDWRRIREAVHSQAPAQAALEGPASSAPAKAARRPRIGIALKSLPSRHVCGEAVNHQLPRRLAAALLTFARRQDCEFDVLPFADADVAAADRLREQLRADGLRVVDAAAPRIDALQARIARLDTLLAVPLHASVFGIACGVPSIGLAYDKKIPRLYQSFDLNEFCLDVNTATAAEIEQRLSSAFQQREQLGQRIREAAGEAQAAIRCATINLLLAGQPTPTHKQSFEYPRLQPSTGRIHESEAIA